MHNERASYLGFKETFAALFVLNCWLREFPLSAIANRFELRCQSKPTRAIVLPNLSLLKNPVAPLFDRTIIVAGQNRYSVNFRTI